MLYCPKCQASYEEGTQRFCTNEGARLLPAPGADSVKKEAGIFTNILNKTQKPVPSPDVVEEKAVPSEEIEKKGVSGFKPPSESKFFASEQPGEATGDPPGEFESVSTGGDKKTAKREAFQTLPLARIINPTDIPEKHTKHDALFPDSDDFLLETGDPLPQARTDSTLKSETDPAESTETAPAESPEFELDLGGVVDPTGEAAAGFEMEDILESPEPAGSDLELNLDEPLNLSPPEPASGGIVLDLDEEIKTFDPDPAAQFEIDLDEIGDVPIPTPTASPFELELNESFAPAEVSGETSQIELDLDGLEVPEMTTDADVSDEPAFGFEREFESKREAKPGREVVLEPIRKPKVVSDTVDQLVSKAAGEPLAEIPPAERSESGQPNWWLLPLLALIVIGVGLVLWYLVGTSNGPTVSNQNLAPVNQSPAQNAVNSIFPEMSITPPNEYEVESEEPIRGDIPPPPRVVKQPPNTIKFRNEKRNQRGNLAQQFLGFSVFYPKGWRENKSDNKFLDISKTTPAGELIEQILIEPYESRGTFSADSEIFEDLVRNSNEDLNRLLPNFQVISQGEATIQNGRWRVYEVKFQGGGTTKQGQKLILWGRRMWIPVQKPGMQSGFIITMLVTSLSNQIKSVEDVGEVGDLATILKTFEPEMR